MNLFSEIFTAKNSYFIPFIQKLYTYIKKNKHIIVKLIIFSICSKSKLFIEKKYLEKKVKKISHLEIKFF